MPGIFLGDTPMTPIAFDLRDHAPANPGGNGHSLLPTISCRFPSVNTLAEAHADEVLKSWENLGYYSRARHLHAAAKNRCPLGSRLPQTRKDLMTLPGIGEYTASAILSIAFALPVAAIDGNVSRVISRLVSLRKSLGSSESRQQIRDLADHLLSRKHPGHFNQAMMDLGATVCTPELLPASLVL